jgi:putative glycosyltransferase (TIGR04372 family)
MTALPPVAHLRHCLNRAEVLPDAPAASHQPPVRASARPQLAWLTGLAFQLYGFLAAQRRRLLPLTSMASALADRWLINGSAGKTLLLFSGRALARGRLVAPLATKATLFGLAIAAQVYVASSQKPSALRAVRLLNLIFRAQVRSRTGLAPTVYFGTLALCEAYDRIVREVPHPEAIESFALNFAVGVAHMYHRSYPAALHFLSAAARGGDSNALRKLGCVHALANDFTKAAECFRASVERDPRSVMSHQNYAAGYDTRAYTPSAWELENAGELLIYDNFIQLGENFYHLARYEDTFRCYQAALDHQDTLARKWSIPQTLIARIAAATSNFKPGIPIRILGYEWVTLIGHIGFIDCHLRMAELGILPRANYVLLAPAQKVVNPAFLSLFAPFLCIVADAALVDELLPYQRLVGDQFIAVRGTGAPAGRKWAEGQLAEPWAHAASRAQIAWAKAKRSLVVSIDESLRARGWAQLRESGITADWFAALHIREGGYHGDGPGTTRQHRSANVGDYLDAIAEVTTRGGAVVRLGDRSMTPLKGLPGVFDYAHSDIKSAEMDLFLCAEARLFIGTTSGLTSAVQALGTPMLLVNCISNDCQFWHDKTDFTLRLVHDRRTNRYLSLRETYRQPLQSLLIDIALLARRGLEIHANQPQDIAAAVAYKLDCMNKKQLPLQGDGQLLEKYQKTMRDNPCNFGAALPVPTFLAAYPELLEKD